MFDHREPSPAPTYRTIGLADSRPHGLPPLYDNEPALQTGWQASVARSSQFRHPEGLHPIYYRLYACSKASTSVIPSIRPVDPNAPFFSLFYLEHVSPPLLPYSLLQHICHRENLDAKQAKLFARELTAGATVSSKLVEITNEEFLTWGPGCPGSREDPLQLVVDSLPEDSARRAASEEARALLPFAGLADSVEMQQRLRASLESAPESCRARFSSDWEGRWASQAIYYRLYCSQTCTAMPSTKPINKLDPSFTRTYSEYVAPPKTVQDYIQYIASLEGFHPERAKAFRRSKLDTGRSEDVELNLTEGIVLERKGAGSVANPILILVDMPMGLDGEVDRVSSARRPGGPFRSLKRWNAKLRDRALPSSLARASANRGQPARPDLVQLSLVLSMILVMFVGWRSMVLLRGYLLIILVLLYILPLLSNAPLGTIDVVFVRRGSPSLRRKW